MKIFNKEQFINKSFGRWKVLSFAVKKQNRNYWNVLCSCGVRKIVPTSKLKSGNSKSCGCLRKELHTKKDTYFNRIFNRYIKQAKERNLIFQLDREYFRYLISNPCYYCSEKDSLNIKDNKNSFKCNGVDRVNNNLGYIKSNCVSCCRLCNLKKGDVSISIIIKSLEFLFENQKDLIVPIYELKQLICIKGD